jgi:hypothetical protein
MKQFLIRSSILTLIVFTVGATLYSTVLKSFYFPLLPFVVFFFFGITNLVHAYFLTISAKSNSRFTSKYMAVNYIKMFFYLLVAIVFVVLNKEIAKVFVANFLVLYIIYTIFEVNEFLKKIKQQH